MCLTVAQATVGGGMLFAYIAAAPFVFQETYDLSAQGFSMVFAANSDSASIRGRPAQRPAAAPVGRPFRLLMAGLVAATGAAAVLAIGQRRRRPAPAGSPRCL